ncbi:hypothetical protein [Pseudomonas sp. GW101-3H06]|uniref:hypothetical protein n=1 Tax=Pseudomonas sp. GW101-3H06 TaxID=2751347 RepID=UPI001A92A59C|nr:hypothetical protein [Pseudomonas sp. GW101-3H06]
MEHLSSTIERTVSTGRLRRLGQWLALLLVITVVPAHAVTQEITAMFRPDPANPNSNKFINTTPISGYCADYPGECQANGVFSIRLPINFNSAYSIQPGASERNGAMFRVPAGWTPITVTNADTGQAERLEIRISGIGTEYLLSDTAKNLTGAASNQEGHHRLWGGLSWVYAPPPCEYSGVGAFGESSYRFFWKTPVHGVCSKKASFLIPGFSYRTLDFAYEMRTPNPLGMSTGRYIGALQFNIGPGGAFDMGDAMVPDDSILILDFALDVQHMLKVELPPGGNQIALQPEGGWQRWLNSGRAPERLFRDQPFLMTASSRFKMYLECGLGTAQCILMNDATTDGTPFKVSVSLPNGLTDSNGRPVKQQELLPTPSGAVIFQPGSYVERKPGVLHFEINKANTDRILKAHKGFRYSGTVLVIWDSEI